MAAAIVTETKRTLTIPRRREYVGQVKGIVRLENALDKLGVAPSDWGPATDRSIEVEVLFDTGATHLCPSASIIARLRLPRVDTVVVQTAAGIGEAGKHSLCQVTLDGRSITVSCLELPDSARPLFGVWPMEEFGVAIDVKEQRYELLSDGDENTYLMA